MTRTGRSTSGPEFEALYRRELPALIALATTLTGDRGLAADLAHETLTRAYRDWAKVGAMERPGAWTRRVAINLAIDAHRKSVREASAAARMLSAPTTGADDDLGVDAFWAAVRGLPERQRAAVALHYLEDMSVADIATTLGVSDGTVKTSLFMARRTLAATFGAEEVLDDNDR